MLRVSNISGFNRQWRPASTSLTLAGTGANNADAGTVAWSNPDRVTADDGSNATASTKGSSTTQYLHATNFSFSIPANSIRIGAQVRKQHFSSGGNMVDHTIQLIVGGTRTGDNKADTMTAWPGSATNADYGDAYDSWNAGLTPAGVNSSSFGFATRATFNTTDGASLDACWISLSYLR